MSMEVNELLLGHTCVTAVITKCWLFRYHHRFIIAHLYFSRGKLSPEVYVVTAYSAELRIIALPGSAIRVFESWPLGFIKVINVYKLCRDIPELYCTMRRQTHLTH